jgi:hypothetical protein
MILVGQLAVANMGELFPICTAKLLRLVAMMQNLRASSGRPGMTLRRCLGVTDEAQAGVCG